MVLQRGFVRKAYPKIVPVPRRPMVLLASVTSRLEKHRHPNIGCLMIPPLRTGQHPDSVDVTWAVDNFAYSKWSRDNFLATVDICRQSRTQPLWIACPDVVGDWKATLDRFEGWSAYLRYRGFRRAFVLQDGQPTSRVPWSDISCVFLGGSTDFKLSESAFRLCRHARAKGLLVHIGRVNSFKRIRRFLDVMHTFDGMSYSRYPDVKLPPLLRWIDSLGA